jgi:AraC-like DNA-binding protein/ligand-binding sensor protein
MKDADTGCLQASDLNYPVLKQLSDLAQDLCQIRFLIVFPKPDGWGQVFQGLHSEKPGFCRLIQNNKQGAKQCRMCHVLAAIAACNGGKKIQTCHSGASTLIENMKGDGEKSFAVLSTCVFIHNGKTDVWKEVEKNGKRMGVDLAVLKEEFNALPKLDEGKIAVARQVMSLAVETVSIIRDKTAAELTVERLRHRNGRAPGVQEMMEHELKNLLVVSSPPLKQARPRKEEGVPMLIRTVCSLVERSPSMPFTVSEIAAAARMTPNHFSTLFHRHMGENFSHFLAAHRMRVAKQHLRDLRLNISDAAAAAGYDDPGYFARVFKRSNGMSPRDWRQKHCGI